MRGKALSGNVASDTNRITPAYAGKSPVVAAGEATHKDHPRLCGEKCRQLDLWSMPEGSPPPMRGKVKQPFLDFLNIGITPAYAGKRWSCSDAVATDEDHPRLCGEKPPEQKKSKLDAGSPPPMRGKAAHSSKYVSRKRITPAYAGKSSRINPVLCCA